MATILSFSKSGDMYVAEATVTGDYNLHLERKKAGKFYIYQRGPASGQYAPVVLPSWLSNSGQIIDYAFCHGVYPEGGLHLRIVSETEVTSGTLSQSAGGGTL